MHPRNPHLDRYDFKALIQCSPELGQYVAPNKYGDDSIDFANPLAVKALNRAILASFYGIKHWDIPPHYLCPPIPGRADYIHYLADLVGDKRNDKILGLDIGVGANCVYPLLGHAAYGWKFVGAECDDGALASAKKIVKDNHLSSVIEIRKQASRVSIFHSIIAPSDHFDFTMCNPPFHASAEEANQGSTRKWKNLGKKQDSALNFGGKGHELWCEGGEKSFILKMIKESQDFAGQCRFFTTLVSKAENLPILQKTLSSLPTKSQIIEMTQGQKKSRILVWSFHQA